jgi:hypothetical protein
MAGVSGGYWVSDASISFGNPFLIGYDDELAKLKNLGKVALYTNASTAWKIIRNKELWLRNARLMNDFREIDFGSQLLKQHWNSDSSNLQSVLGRHDPSFVTMISEQLNKIDNFQINDTYLMSMTSHVESDDGRLSMWRAYGGANSVAMIFDVSKLMGSQVNLPAVALPVRYLNEFSYSEFIGKLTAKIQEEFSTCEPAGRENLSRQLLAALHYSVLTTKYLGFAEEREWRLVFGPNYSVSSEMKFDIEEVAGVPQKVYKLPIDDLAVSNGPNIKFKELLSEIIVGPTNTGNAIKEAFEEILRAEDMGNDLPSVSMSEIPLRR